MKLNQVGERARRWTSLVMGTLALVFTPNAWEGRCAEPAAVGSDADAVATETSMLPGSRSPALDESIESEYTQVDPDEGDWRGERAQKDLAKRVEKILRIGATSGNTDLWREGLRTRPLRPELDEVFRDAVQVVRRPQPGDGDLVSIGQGIVEFFTPFRSPADTRIEAKVVGIREIDGILESRMWIQVVGASGRGVLEANLIWNLSWRPVEGADDFVLIGLEPLSYEEVERLDSSLSNFADMTEAVLGGEPSFESHLRYGLDHWRRRLEASVGPGIVSETGLAIGDANGDGLDDVFLPQAKNLPNRLLIQQSDGTVVDRAREAGLDLLAPCRSALFLDLDNDGDQDLLIGADGGLLVYENSGALRYFLRYRAPFLAKMESLAAADYDADGLVDVYICGHTPPGEEHANSVLGAPKPIYDARNGQPNLMLKNVGAFRFVDITRATGLDEDNTRFSYAAAWEDFDNDRDVDLYVANDFGPNHLFRNNGDGSFSEVARELGVEDIASGMSVSWGDYDNDGWVDLYIGNMFSSAGFRVAYQRNFREGATEEELSALRRMARGNTMFRNLGGKRFEDVSEDLGVTMGRWAWSSPFIDFNGDGWEDLLVANGFVTNQRLDDL